MKGTGQRESVVGDMSVAATKFSKQGSIGDGHTTTRLYFPCYLQATAMIPSVLETAPRHPKPRGGSDDGIFRL
jgi:hypothetical protein